jgi:hypothetical protein
VGAPNLNFLGVTQIEYSSITERVIDDVASTETSAVSHGLPMAPELPTGTAPALIPPATEQTFVRLRGPCRHY